MLKSRTILSTAIVLSCACCFSYACAKNQLPKELREYSHVQDTLPLRKELSRSGISATTPPFSSGTDSQGNYEVVYLDKNNVPVTFKVIDDNIVYGRYVTEEDRAEIVRMAKLLFGEDVICEIPELTNGVTEVIIHGDVYFYENGTLERDTR